MNPRRIKALRRTCLATNHMDASCAKSAKREVTEFFDDHMSAARVSCWRLQPASPNPIRNLCSSVRSRHHRSVLRRMKFNNGRITFMRDRSADGYSAREKRWVTC